MTKPLDRSLDRNPTASPPDGDDPIETLEFARHFINAINDIEAGELETIRGCYAEDAQI